MFQWLAVRFSGKLRNGGRIGGCGRDCFRFAGSLAYIFLSCSYKPLAKSVFLLFPFLPFCVPFFLFHAREVDVDRLQHTHPHAVNRSAVPSHLLRWIQLEWCASRDTMCARVCVCSPSLREFPLRPCVRSRRRCNLDVNAVRVLCINHTWYST